MTICWPELLCREVCCLLGAQVWHIAKRLLRLVWALDCNHLLLICMCTNEKMLWKILNASGVTTWLWEWGLRHDQHLLQLVVLSRIWLLQPWDLLLGTRSAVEKGDPPHKKATLPAAWPVWWGELYTRNDWGWRLQSGGERGEKQRMQGDWYKTPQEWYNRAKGASLKCMHANAQTLGIELEELELRL